MNTEPEEHLMEKYLEVSRVWNNPRGSKRKSITFIEAVDVLHACLLSQSKVLRARAAGLLDEIVNKQDPVTSVEQA